MRIVIATLILLAAGCEFGLDQSTLVTPNYDLLDECERPDLAQASAIIAEGLCGTLDVAENPNDPAGRRISLNIMLLPATSAVVKPDPIFFLAGGPGQSAVDAGVFVFSHLSEARRERDIVLVDQRGTGKSNPLGCDLVDSDQGFERNSEQALAISLEHMKACLAAYDADPAFYTTPIAMDDLNLVREHLGYQQINLLGGSYGTRAALVYMRRHGDTVRSALLDGLAPTTMRIPANIATDADAAFTKLLTDCQAQKDCRDAFPKLAEHYDALTERLREAPEKVSLIHSRTGENLQGFIDAKLLTGVVRNVLYDRLLSTLVPLAIEEAYAGNYQMLASLALVFAPESPIINIGMMASVLCAEDMQLTTSASPTSRFDNQIYDLLGPVCEFWPQGAVPDNYFDPVRSDVPTLLLSGALDPVTPPKYAWEAAETLSNVEHVVVAGVGHGVSLQGCVPGIIADFFSDPVPAKVNAGCTANLGRMSFFTSYAGPVPMKDEEDD